MKYYVVQKDGDKEMANINFDLYEGTRLIKFDKNGLQIGDWVPVQNNNVFAFFCGMACTALLLVFVLTNIR